MLRANSTLPGYGLTQCEAYAMSEWIILGGCGVSLFVYTSPAETRLSFREGRGGSEATVE